MATTHNPYGMTVFKRAAVAATRFFKPPVATVDTPDNTARSGALYGDSAVDNLITMLSKMPDVDETLRAAGIMRHKLRVLLSDDEISQGMETRLDALLSTPMRIEEAVEGTGNEAFEMFLNVEMARHFEQMISGAWESLGFGYSVLEAVYQQAVIGSTDPYDSYIRIGHIGLKPMEWFEPRNDGSLIFRPRMGTFSVDRNDPFFQLTENGDGFYVDQRFKFFCTRRRATYQQPYGESLLSRLYWPWFFRQNGWRFWGKFLERFGAPLLVGSTVGHTSEMITALLLAHSQSAIAVGDGDKITAVEASGQGANFPQFEEAVVRRIQKVILGQTLTSGTDGGSGNRALGKVHNEVRGDKKISDIRLIGPTLQRICDALCMLNNVAPGTYTVWLADEEGLSKDRADRDYVLWQSGVRFTADYYVNNFELREEDFTLAPPAPEASPPGQTQNPAVDEPVDPKGAAASRRAGRFARRSTGARFTKPQKVIEDLVDDVESQDPQPIDTGAVRACIVSASSPKDLEDRLFALVGDDPAFQELLERSLFAADVLGYVHATGKV